MGSSRGSNWNGDALTLELGSVVQIAGYVQGPGFRVFSAIKHPSRPGPGKYTSRAPEFL